MDLVVELKIENPNDWATIERLLKRLKVSFVRKSVELPVVSKEQQQLDELYALLEGVDVSNYGDPIEFQREVRDECRVRPTIEELEARLLPNERRVWTNLKTALEDVKSGTAETTTWEEFQKELADEGYITQTV
jgi:hypothetical protein